MMRRWNVKEEGRDNKGKKRKRARKDVPQKEDQ